MIQILRNGGVMDGMIKYIPPTRGIKHWGLGGYTSIQPRIKFGVTG